MKKLSIYYMLLVCLLTFAACSDDDYTPNVSPLKITESNVAFTAKGGEGEIVVTSTTPIASVASSDSWCTAATNGDYKVKVSVAVNDNLDSRSSVVTIKDQNGNETNIAVTQAGLLFVLNKHKFVVGDDAATSFMKLVHSNDVTVSVAEDVDWLQASIVGDSLQLNPTANTTGEVRSGYVYCQCGPREDSVLVVQGSTADLYGDYYFAGQDKSGKLMYIKSTLSQGTSSDNLKLTFPDWKGSLLVDFDEENMEFKFRGGQYVGDWVTTNATTGDKTTTYIYTVVWDIKKGYLSWSEDYSMDGVIYGDPQYGTLIDFQDNGSWSGYTIGAIRFELFSKKEAVKANRLNKTLVLFIYPFMQKMKEATNAKYTAIPFL